MVAQVSRRLARSGLVAALAVAPLAACGPAPPPFATAPSDGAVQQALLARIAMTDEPMPPAPNADSGDLPPTPCAALFQVQSLSVTQQPTSQGQLLEATAYQIAVSSTYTVTRIAPDPPSEQGPQANSIGDCFGPTASPPASWGVGQSVVLQGSATITYKGPYWLLRDGDVVIPLASGSSHPFTVKALPAH
jgi:hypothetical protein